MFLGIRMRVYMCVKGDMCCVRAFFCIGIWEPRFRISKKKKQKSELYSKPNGSHKWHHKLKLNNSIILERMNEWMTEYRATATTTVTLDLVLYCCCIFFFSIYFDWVCFHLDKKKVATDLVCMTQNCVAKQLNHIFQRNIMKSTNQIMCKITVPRLLTCNQTNEKSKIFEISRYFFRLIFLE